MSINTYKHNDKRKHIPSREEAGYEEASPAVADGKKTSDYPRNPVVHRGQDPELFWLDKYGGDDAEDRTVVDIRSLYRHEHIAPETLIKGLYRLKEEKRDPNQIDLFSVNELFGNALDMDELEKVSEYYRHEDGWSNRLIQGDSLLVMTSLLEREGMAGKVQCIYIDPPYGIKYGSNWQMKLNKRDVKDGRDEELSGEPEQIKAYRDTWELGIHSYLSYLRDRLLVARELLTDSGSCFMQISDENVHLVRCLMDEVFGSENFTNQITYMKSSPLASKNLPSVCDFILWYGKDIESLKYRQIFQDKNLGEAGASRYKMVELKTRERMLASEHQGELNDVKFFTDSDLSAMSLNPTNAFAFEFEGKKFYPSSGRQWQTHLDGLKRLAAKKRILVQGKRLRFIRYFDDFPVNPITNIWTDIGGIQSRSDPKVYAVQTSTTTIQRCILMTTDPGDLVLDPTCGSGTTAYVAEQWGRRWITIDTSRIAVNIAKTRLMTATYPYYKLYDENGDLRQGFQYKKVPHITLKSLANDEPPGEETLYDQPFVDKKKLRVAGPFTVETLQNFEPVSPEELQQKDAAHLRGGPHLEAFEERIFAHLKSAGVKNGIRNEHALFIRVDRLSSPWLHAEGFYQSAGGEKKAYIHIGPKFGTVSRQAVNEAVKECRTRGDADWLIILGFSFESSITNENVTTSMGSFEVTKVRMHDDLMQDGLLKKDKKAASFVTIGEPDVRVDSGEWVVLGNGKEIMPYDIFKELSGIDRLAEIDGLGREGVSGDGQTAAGGKVRADQPDASSRRVDSVEHRRRAIEELNKRVSQFSQHRTGQPGRTGDTTATDTAAELSQSNAASGNVHGNLKNDQWSHALAQIKMIAADHLPLTTRHLSLVTIQGLDIYDPISDTVKARDVHDIAYWMVDDDYDGSNFVVRQVFFCGGKNEEFKKWEKGLSNLVARGARRNAERTLKIEIDEEAFERLYGFRSHPIETKHPGQKIAVRVISQFGEESTKVVQV